jgi:ADP-heptose:LPS heptosyltransferase/tetratricopeptide (TPR) repeat protein
MRENDRDAAWGGVEKLLADWRESKRRENDEARKCLPRVRKYLFGSGLDVGCGNFPVVENAIGIDFREGPARIKSDVKSLPMFADGGMDFVFSSHCLEDIKEHKSALAEWCRVLKPGGYLVLYLPHEDYYPRVGHPLANRDHVHNFNPWSVASILQDPSFPHSMWVMSTSVHGFTGKYEEQNLFTAEYSFQVVAQKRGVEPEWAQSRLWIPGEVRASAQHGDGYRLVVVSDSTEDGGVAECRRIAGMLGQSAGKLSIISVAGADVRNMDDVSSKALVSTAWLVVDLTEDGCAEAWAASYDCDYVGAGAPDKNKWGYGRGPRTLRAEPTKERLTKIVKGRIEAPTSGMSLCMIAKNEEQDLPSALGSLDGVADEIVLVDTGSTDKTRDIAISFGAKVYFWPWQDDFAAARNFSLDRARRSWTMWMDADDVMTSGHAGAKALCGRQDADVSPGLILYGDAKFEHQRFFRTAANIRFGEQGIVHEYPVIDGKRFIQSNVLFTHGLKPAPPTKQRESRNLRLARKQAKCWPENPRHWFYLGNAERESGFIDDAIASYKHYVSIGKWRDEMSLAWRHMGHCYAMQNKFDEAKDAFLKAVAVDSRWAETYFDLGTLAYNIGNLGEAVGWFEMASRTPLHDSPLFKQAGVYGPESIKAVLRCHIRTGNTDAAMEAGKRLQELGVEGPEVLHLRAIADKEPGAVQCPICGNTPIAAPSLIGPDWGACEKCDLFAPFKAQPTTPLSAIRKAKIRESMAWADATKRVANDIFETTKNIIGRSPERAFDIMSSAPVIAEALNARGCKTTSLDACPEAASIMDGMDVIVSKWEDADVSQLAGECDLVVLLNSLQHFVHLRDDMKKAVACLKPGGVVYSRHIDHDVRGVEGRVKAGETHWIMTRRSVEALATAVGLEVVAVKNRDGCGESDVIFRKPESGTLYRPSTAIRKDKPLLIARNGAVGDVLMATYALKKLNEEAPGRLLYFAAHPSCWPMLERNRRLFKVVPTDSIPGLLATGSVSEVRYCEYPTLKPKPTECAPHRMFDYPSLPMPMHLVDMFAECCGILEPHGGKVGSLELSFSLDEGDEAKKICRMTGRDKVISIQTEAGWSRYKEWPIANWSKVAAALLKEGYGVVHVGPGSGAALALGDTAGFVDVRGKVPVRIGAAVVKRAILHLGIDSVMNHVTNAVGTKGVILWGSTSPSGSAYPHNINVIAPPSRGCQPCYRENPEMPSVHPKPACPFSHDCMTAISVENVMSAIEQGVLI